MPLTDNPGKYDDLCQLARVAAEAKGAVLMVFDGKAGNGFSVQLTPELLVLLPGLLDYMAKEIRRDLVKKGLVKKDS